jgi:hypothetical protein
MGKTYRRIGMKEENKSNFIDLIKVKKDNLVRLAFVNAGMSDYLKDSANQRFPRVHVDLEHEAGIIRENYFFDNGTEWGKLICTVEVKETNTRQNDRDTTIGKIEITVKEFPTWLYG